MDVECVYIFCLKDFPGYSPLTPGFSEIDYTFFLATVDLWSEDGKQEMNLVLHPTSSDRSVPFQAKARKRLNSGKTRPSANGTPVPGPSVHPASQADASVSRSSILIVPPLTLTHRRARRALITPILRITITLLIPSNHRIRRRWNPRITLVPSKPVLSGTTAHINPEMRVGIPNPLSHPYSH